MADEARFRQVLLDLVFNARDAGAARIELRIGHVVLGPEDPRCVDEGLVAGTYGVIDVVDDGAGMDAATMERIFDPFFTTKAEDVGSGLGLANVQDFALQSLGAACVSSTPGSGTTMSVLLPAIVAAGAPSTPRARRHARRILAAATFDRREELSEALAAANAQLVCVEDLDRVAYSLETEPIDLVILDETLMGPSAVLDGLDGVPVIVVTTRGIAHPQATLTVASGDTAGLLQAVADLLPASQRADLMGS